MKISAIQIISYGILGFLGIYILSRIISYAFAKSWFKVKHLQNKEVQNGKEEREGEEK